MIFRHGLVTQSNLENQRRHASLEMNVATTLKIPPLPEEFFFGLLSLADFHCFHDLI